MKKVDKEKKPVSTVYRIVSIVLSILLVLLSAFLIFELKVINFLPGLWFVCATIVIILIDLIILFIMNTRKNIVARIISIILCIALSTMYGIGGYYVLKTNGTISNITGTSDTKKTTVSVIALSSSKEEELKDLNGEKVGKLATIDTTSTEKCLDKVKEENVSFLTTDYNDVISEVAALYSGEVQAIILNENYRSSVKEDENYTDFDTNTKVIYKVTFETKNVTTTEAVSNITNTPFNILISGSDSRGGIEDVARSDVNMVVTVNPKTGTILLTSIPRDFYVTTVCNAVGNCPNGQLDKITHTGIYGVQTTKETVENLLGITINYTVRVGFDAVERLVDAVDGIDVNVAEGYAVDRFWTDDNGVCSGVTEGVNHLNGTCALCYARERYAYAEGDRQRAKNQQEVLIQIAKKCMSFSAVTNFTSLLDAINGYFETDMSSEEIQELIKYQVKNMKGWTFQQYSVDGTGSTENCAALGTAAYVMIPDQTTVDTAKAKIQAVLDGKSADDVQARETTVEEAPVEETPAEETTAETPTYEAGYYIDEAGNTYYMDEYGNVTY